MALVFSALFSITTFSFGFAIAQSVVEEKQSRVVEILVAAVPVRLLLLGKVLGTTLLALGQLVLLLTGGLVAAVVLGQGEAVSLVLGSAGWFLVFFVLGFGMLSCLWAVSGSIAGRQEDLQATTLPLQALVVVPFFAAVSVGSPGALLTTLSYLPFTAPLVMPRRLLLEDAAAWEPFAAAVVTVLTGAAFIALAARIYEVSLLRTRDSAP